MKRSSTRTRRASLTGWWKGLPLIMPVFSVLFLEAWLHTQILANQYKANDLTTQTREIEGRIDSLRGETQRLTRMERINAKAPDLGLIEPDPGQIETIRDRSHQEEDLAREGFAVARRDEGARHNGLPGRGPTIEPEPKGVTPAFVSGADLPPSKDRAGTD